MRVTMNEPRDNAIRGQEDRIHRDRSSSGLGSVDRCEVDNAKESHDRGLVVRGSHGRTTGKVRMAAAHIWCDDLVQAPPLPIEPQTPSQTNHATTHTPTARPFGPKPH